MRKLLYLGALGLALFEAANVYFIMPMPGSQRARSVELAYTPYTWRWAVRVACVALMAAGLPAVLRGVAGLRRGRVRAAAPAALALVLAGGVAYAANARLAADHMFLQPRAVRMAPAAGNGVDPRRLVVGVEVNGEARAYPLQFIGYHHQVRDTVGGTPVLVTYCTVCRTGRVYRPEVGGRGETFRLVGMDHFNAMLEDRTTGSWWRQANGEAIVGPRKGTRLAEVPSRQVTLARWLAMHPDSRVMQPDPAFAAEYAKGFAYEDGSSRRALTGTDPVSWRDKAWVVGLTVGEASKAYDWNRLRRERVVNDDVGGTPVVVVLASDGASFFAFRRPDRATRFALRGDSLVAPGRSYALSGRGPAALGGRGPADSLVPLPASQEFWHSWRTFQPGTARY
ncbi:hypothetical protein tb265_02710 [Gemmatimonadetes bacterium T265]|nr:hypothetical protein tb265_02710 [Gemmatimonadetes bacterium T265]